MKKYAIQLFLVMVLGLLMSSMALAETIPAPQHLKVPALAVDEQSMTLVWEKTDNQTGIVDYHIYMNGKLLGNVQSDKVSAAKPSVDKFYAKNPKAQITIKHSYIVTGLAPSSKYKFTVRAVDTKGNESLDSNIIEQKTMAIPKIFNIQSYGAVGDGTTLNTKAIQKAIDACTPGDKVLVPAGVFKTGQIWLKSNMTLEVAKGATLLGSENAKDYSYHFKMYPYSSDERFFALINAGPTEKEPVVEKIRIVGEGTIDGNGWQKNTEQTAYLYAHNTIDKAGVMDQNHVLNIGILAKAQVENLMQAGQTFKSSYPRRSNLITLRGVKEVYYGGITVINPANHTIVNIKCDDVTVNDVAFHTFDCNNGDGIEFIHGNGLTVINNYFDTGDDCVNFAAGLGALGQKDPSTKNIWIFNNYFYHGHGAVVTGSHTAAWIENILAEDNVIENTDVGFRAKTAPQIGGGARNIIFRDNALKNIKNQAFIFTSGYSDPNAVVEYEKSKISGIFKNIRIENCTVDTTGGAAIEIQGAQNGFHENLYFSNIMFYNTKPMKINYLKNGSFENLTFQNDKAKDKK
ncbi:MAG: Exo-poly-alpha-galacturonosidase [Firmicutes bacterium]|nr:Exo-poly-alpha-galacturonosidase [Bacillota bacterium]